MKLLEAERRGADVRRPDRLRGLDGLSAGEGRGGGRALGPRGHAVRRRPSRTTRGNASYKVALERAKRKASQVHFEKGKMYRASGRPDLAVVEFAQTVLLDPTNDYAVAELRKSEAEAAKQEAERSADSKMQTLKKKTKGARAVTPMLEPSSDRPINLNFPQPKPIKQIYRALADAAGINVVFDPQLKDDNVSIVLSSIDFQKALETLHPAGEPLLQDHRRAHDPDRRRHPAEPEDLRGPRHPDVLPVERRRHRGRQRPARAPPDDAHLGQQGRELDHPARHRRQGRRGRAHRRAERQAGRRGRGRRRTPADQRDQGAEPRASAGSPGGRGPRSRRPARA